MYDKLTYINELGGSVEFSLDSGFILTNNTSGLTGNSISVTTAKGVGQTGETLESAFVQTRPITMEGFIQGLSTAGKERLLRVVLPEVPAKLYHNDEYYLSVTPTATPTIQAEDYFARFQFSLLAPYPYWISRTGQTTALFEILPKFKFPLKWIEPYSFGEATDTKWVNVLNTGQIETPFKVIFKASSEVISPKITNVNTGQFLLLNRTLQPSEVVTIDITHDLTYVISSIDGDIRGDLDIDSDLFRLNVGDNILKPEAEEGLTGMTITVEYNYEKAGVALR